jgi:hypothetical protein
MDPPSKSKLGLVASETVDFWQIEKGCGVRISMAALRLIIKGHTKTREHNLC